MPESAAPGSAGAGVSSWSQAGTAMQIGAENADELDPMDFIVRAAQGDFESAETRRRLQDGCRLFLDAGGELSLERCLQLPRTPAQMRRARRNYWLRYAGKIIGAPAGWSRAVTLAEEIKVFETRNVWRRWSELDSPPSGASELRAALFHAFKAGADVPSTPEGLDKILRAN